MPKNLFLIIFLSTLLLAGTSFSQRIDAYVSIAEDALSDEAKEKLADFTDKVETYINNNDRCPNEWNTEVIVNINMVLSDISSGAEEKYNCQTFQIGTNYDIQLSDKRWKFAYDSKDNLTYDDTNYDSFTSMIEFYLYLILGFEYDKWGTLAGDIYYEKAKYIAEQSKFGLGRFVDGWDKRLDLVNYFLSDRHKPFREMVDYYFYGLSFVNEDNEKVRKHIATAIEKLDRILADDPENEYAEYFLSAHRGELIDIYRNAINKEPIRLLMIMDTDDAYKREYQDILNN